MKCLLNIINNMLILVGASASGKTEIAKELMKRFNIKKVVTHTTREKRVNEVNDVDYHFVSKEEFLSLLDQDKFVEHSLYNGNYYGCSKDEIGDDKVVILDPNGLKSFNKLNDKRIVSILLTSKEQTRYERMIARGDSRENAEKRISNDKTSFALDNIDKVDYIIENDTKELDDVVNEVYNLYKSKLENI